jgi:hypothetical protein
MAQCRLAVTVYIGGLFERTTLTASTGPGNHDTLHVLDGSARVAVIRAGRSRRIRSRAGGTSAQGPLLQPVH